jgi:hypothetical protein
VSYLTWADENNIAVLSHVNSYCNARKVLGHLDVRWNVDGLRCAHAEEESKSGARERRMSEIRSENYGVSAVSVFPSRLITHRPDGRLRRDQAYTLKKKQAEKHRRQKFLTFIFHAARTQHTTRASKHTHVHKTNEHTMHAQGGIPEALEGAADASAATGGTTGASAAESAIVSGLMLRRSNASRAACCCCCRSLACIHCAQRRATFSNSLITEDPVMNHGDTN